ARDAARSLLRTRDELGPRGDLDTTARLLRERHVDRVRVDGQRSGDVVPDPHGQRFAEVLLVPEPPEVVLQRPRLEATSRGPVADRERVQVGLVRKRADGCQLVAGQLDFADTWVRKRLELGHRTYCRPRWRAGRFISPALPMRRSTVGAPASSSRRRA